MASRRRTVGVVVLGVLLAAVALAFGGPLADVSDVDENAEADVNSSTPTPTPTTATTSAGDGDPTLPATSERVTVVILSADGSERGRVSAAVADDPAERYTGLSETESLGPDEGMLFVYEETGDRTFVMRDMDFPLDMVFVHGNGTITRIHHAPVEDDPLKTRYTGRARWVLEVNRGWTTDHGVRVGDEIQFEGSG